MPRYLAPVGTAARCRAKTCTMIWNIVGIAVIFFILSSVSYYFSIDRRLLRLARESKSENREGFTNLVLDTQCAG